MGRIIDITKSTKTLSKSDIASLEGDVGYYSRMLDDDWHEPYDKYFDFSDVEEHCDALVRAIDDVEHGDERTTKCGGAGVHLKAWRHRTTKQALAFATTQFKRNSAATALHTALTGGTAARDADKVRNAAIKVAETWSKTYKDPIPIFIYANTWLTDSGAATVAWE